MEDNNNYNFISLQQLLQKIDNNNDYNEPIPEDNNNNYYNNYIYNF